MSIEPTTSRLLLRLSAFEPLTTEEADTIEHAAGPVRLHRAHESLIVEGESAAHIGLLLSGFAVSGAMFLILELDRPFEGLIQIPAQALRQVYANLGT